MEEKNKAEITKSRNLLRRILYRSNLEHCGSCDDMQSALEDIQDLIKNEYPKLKEKED